MGKILDVFSILLIVVVACLTFYYKDSFYLLLAVIGLSFIVLADVDEKLEKRIKKLEEKVK